jgi:hypothetical protein
MSASRSGSAEVSGWVTGFAVFAGIMLIVTGVFQAIEGLAAIIKDGFYVVTRSYAFRYDVTGWGWVHLIIGIVVALAGGAVLSGKLWGRVIGIIVALVSAVTNFVFIPYYPVWSIMIIALDVVVIWALCKYSRRDAEGSFS